MTERQWENFFKKLEEAQNMVCSQNECDHFHCSASIDGCYGDECAFQWKEHQVDPREIRLVAIVP